MALRNCLLPAFLLVLPVLLSAQWASWRGPLQTGVSAQAMNFPDSWTEDNQLWTYDIKGGGTPVVHEGRVYVFGYYGEVGTDVEEALLCLDLKTGKKLWEHRFSDFISDIIYNRYAIGAPAVDPKTGNVYMQTSPGLLLGFTRDGKKLWEVSMMEEFGRLTFPNGRTGGPVVDGDLVIVHAITANWGTNGPARDRFYAYDKTSGELVWYSTPGIRPKDSSFSTPVFGAMGSKRVLYAGTGCGNIVCVDARTGQPMWRYQMSNGGVNSTPILTKRNTLVAIHGKENINESTIGRMIELRLPAPFLPDTELPVVLKKETHQNWQADLEAFTSSPVYVDDMVITTVKVGELIALDAKTGEQLWMKKLAPDQLHASPAYADGKLYVPMLDGSFYIIEASREKAEILQHVELDELMTGAPAVADGRVLLLTKGKLYCFGNDAATTRMAKPIETIISGPATELQVVPAEFLMKPGETQTFEVRALDASGKPTVGADSYTFEKYIPPTARVKAEVDATFTKPGVLVANDEASISAGAMKVTSPDGLTGFSRGRLIPDLPYTEDFEDFALTASDPDGYDFAYPPLPWIGARIRWQVIDDPANPGNKILANTLDNILFQRSMNFIGTPDMSNYIMTADVMTDGNRRIMSTVGVVNQRYKIALVGNWQILEVSSNHDRVKTSVPFSIRPNTWYTLKTLVKAHKDGSGHVLVKAWPKAGEEPEEWTMKVTIDNIHTHGSPGLYAFSPQAQKRVYVDNISIVPNDR